MIYLAINLACTGIGRTGNLDDQSFPRPVALGAVQWDDTSPFSRYEGYIRQEDKSVSAAAEKSHSVKDRIAKSRGLPERTALSWLTNTLKTSTHVVGWSLDFELDVIRSALIRHGGNPDSLIRPGLIKISLQAICMPIVGKQDDDGGYIPPTIPEAIKALGLGEDIATDSVLARAEACRALMGSLCADGIIPDLEQAA